MTVRRWPPFQVFSMTGEVTVVVPPGTSLGPARDYRLLWADPAVKGFVGPSENDWEFNRLGGIPGFGPLPEPGGER